MEPVYRSLELAFGALASAQDVHLSVRGVDHIPDDGGAVLAINHTAYVDFLPVVVAMRRSGRRARFMIKAELMESAIMRFVVAHTGSVPVNRSAGAQAYAVAVEQLAAGEIVAIYPEATISRSCEIEEFKTGAVRMALEAGVPLIPTIVWGAQRQWTKGHRSMGRHHYPVSVRFGAPVWPSGGAVTDLEAIEADTQALHSVMVAMLDEVRGEQDARRQATQRGA